MELNRLARVLRDRWRIVALIAAIGFLSAFGFTTLANRTIEERYEALIPLRFDLVEGETIDDLATKIDDARGQATIAAEDLLNAYENSTIFADTASGRLFFRAEGVTEDVALQRADALLSAYYRSDVGGGNIEAQLSDLEENAERVVTEIEATEKTLTTEEQAIVQQHEVIDLQIDAVTNQIVALTVADAGATPAERATNAEIRTDLEAQLTALLEQKQALPPEPSTALSPSEQLRLDSLRRQLEVIGLEYQRLSLRTVGVLAENAQQEFPRINSLNPAPPNPGMNGVIGLIGGIGLGLVALVFVTRSRKEVWLADDLPVPVLGEVPHRKVSALPGPSWYDSTSGGRRKEAVQATRTAVEGALGQLESASIAIVGDRVGPVATHALAVDLAASFASAGHSVLLIGAYFTTPIEMTEFEVGEPTLRTVLAAPAGSAQALDDALEALLGDVVQIRSDLTVLPAGRAPESPADALAGQQFRRFIGLARERFDLVIAVGGEAESASSQVLTQRLKAAIVAISPGSTTVPRINGILVDLTNQRVSLPGVVMLHGSDSRFSIPRLRWRSTKETSLPPPSQDTISRLGQYPFPGSKRSFEPSDGSLDHLAEDLASSRIEETGPDGLKRTNLDQAAEALERTETVEHAGPMKHPTPREHVDPIAMQVLEALESSDTTRAFEPVAQYVVARVEDMMTAVPGQTNLSPEMVHVATAEAFVPLTPVRGIPTIWERLVGELQRDFGESLGNRLASRIAAVLTGDVGIASQSVDDWLSREFFRRHLLRTGREPAVWHVSSPAGAVQVLVNGRRLTDERIGRMTTDVVRRRIHELEQELKELRAADAADEAAVVESEIKDARLFEISLGALRGGTRDEARLVYPWRKQNRMPRGWNPIWSEGVRPNIAPLQKLELLAEPVLTDDELRELAPTG